MSIDWDQDKYIKLIQLYERNPILWDAQNVQHYNKNLKNDAWKSIGKEMAEDEDVIKKKNDQSIGVIQARKIKNQKFITYRKR